MANIQLGGIDLSWANKNTHSNAGNTAAAVATPANYASVTALRSRLATINAGYYTAAKLNQMTLNDMVYAVRLNDDSTTI